jgi:hypothetical protein
METLACWAPFDAAALLGPLVLCTPLDAAAFFATFAAASDAFSPTGADAAALRAATPFEARPWLGGGAFSSGAGHGRQRSQNTRAHAAQRAARRPSGGHSSPSQSGGLHGTKVRLVASQAGHCIGLL